MCTRSPERPGSGVTDDRVFTRSPERRGSEVTDDAGGGSGGGWSSTRLG